MREKYPFSPLALFFFALFILSPLPGQAAETTLIPKEFIESHLKDYSEEEIKLIKVDFSNIRQLCFRDILTPKGQKIYVATAAGPGASKSTILEQYIHDKPNFAYLDPDQRSLKYMINTYLQEFTPYKIAQASTVKPLLQKAYDKWRGGSNYIASTLINEAFAKGFNIAHGTTSTGAHVKNLYKKLKEKGYKIVLLLCNTTDEDRIAALQHRVKDQCFCQVDPEDVVNKGKAYPERFVDYFTYGDEIYLYWIGDFQKGATLAASLERGKKMQVYDQKALEKVIAQYDQGREGKDLQPLQELITAFENG